MMDENKHLHLPGWLKTGAVYIFFDTFCAGMGMGVPIFNIFLGFVSGWIIGRKQAKEITTFWEISGRIIKMAILTSSFTVLLMAVIWTPTIIMLFNPAADLENFGIPMILYEPRASFIGWLILMIVISPVLQVMTTVFGSTAAIWAEGFRQRGETVKIHSL